jgi:hypothetical protein
MSARFLDWLYYSTGLLADEAQARLSLERRNELVAQWIKARCPYAIGV